MSRPDANGRPADREASSCPSFCSLLSVKALKEHEETGGDRLSWNGRLTLKLLRAEAESLLAIEEQ